jgi:hypothetical protein
MFQSLPTDFMMLFTNWGVLASGVPERPRRGRSRPWL